jgi:type II secretory ATPase GspE/PulE/Tfp pilus assembly ATPase PilB-like protein/CheY-like chemotaxis protein
VAKGLQHKHWLTHVLKRAGVDAAEEWTLDPGVPAAEAWMSACQVTNISQDTLARHVADYFRLKVAALDAGEPTALKLVPEKVARQYSVFPLKENDRHLFVATSDPTNFSAEQALGFISGRKAIFEVAPPPYILDAINGHYSPEGVTGSLPRRVDQAIASSATVVESQDERTEAVTEAVTEAEAEAAPVIKLTNLILRDAAMKGASDVHIEPGESGGTIRFRVDGVLRSYMQLPLPALIRVVSRIKIMGQLDSADKRPQDGRTRVIVEGRPYDIRISTVPMRSAEKAVLRILKGGQAAKLAELGLPSWELGRLRQLLSHRDGIVCVTGPTGSGKTTTLYGAIREIATGEVNVMTVEDPVEHELAGITQIQVQTRRGVTFAGALRAILRQDPDVILVSEIRDQETAEVAVQAAMTGHLVLATLHTEDAVSVIARLLDIGLDRASIAATLRGAVAQRLLRRVCDECGEPIRGEMTDDEVRLAKRYNLRPPIRSVGCRHCAETGYRGRLPVQEVFVMNNALADLVTGGATYTELYDLAVSSGMRPLVQVGLERVRGGDTTLEELERVLGLEEGDDAAPDEPAAPPLSDPDPETLELIIAASELPSAPSRAQPAVEAPLASPDPPDRGAEGVTDERAAPGGEADALYVAPDPERILVVDDDPEDRLLVRTLMQKYGWKVEEVQDGGEALDRLESDPGFDLVVLDLEMPIVDGREVLERLRATGATVPVVVLTGSPDPEDEYRLMEGGADDYLRKPLDPPRFVARVKAALRRAGMV